MNEPFQAYVVRDALTKGVRLATLREYFTNIFNEVGTHNHFHKASIFKNIEDANGRAEQMRLAKIKRWEKELARLKVLKFV